MSENTLSEAVSRRGRPHYPRAGPGLDFQSANGLGLTADGPGRAGPGRDFQGRAELCLVHVFWDWTLSQCWWRVVIQRNWHFKQSITYLLTVFVVV